MYVCNEFRSQKKRKSEESTAGNGSPKETEVYYPNAIDSTCMVVECVS